MRVEYRKREIDKYRVCLYCEGGLINHAWSTIRYPGVVIINLVLDRRGNQYQDCVFLN